MNLIRLVACCCALTFANAATLPRVLILGDSVYRHPQGAISKELSGKIELARPEIPSGEICSSTAALAHLDQLLGDGKWDLVIFNVGIGDLMHRAPGMKSFRLMPIEQGGVRNTSASDYESNLNELVKRLKATRAKLVWVSTTPLTPSTALFFAPGSETEANAIAAKVMASHRIPVLDLHGHITRLTANPPRHAPKWETFGSNAFLIHEPIVQVIKSQLSLP